MDNETKEYPDPPELRKMKSFAMTTGNIHFTFSAEGYIGEFSIIQEYHDEYGPGSARIVSLSEKDIIKLEEFIQHYKLCAYDENESKEELEKFYEEYPDHPERPDHLPF